MTRRKPIPRTFFGNLTTGVSSSVALMSVDGSRELIRDFLTIRLDELNKKLVQCAQSTVGVHRIGPRGGRNRARLTAHKIISTHKGNCGLMTTDVARLLNAWDIGP